MFRPYTSEGRASHLRRYDQPLTPGQGVAHVHATLAGWGLDGDSESAMDAVLVAGELLANARQHAGGIQALDMVWQGTCLRISVRDGSGLAPRLTWPHDHRRAAGHGMRVVERLATRWGTCPRADGKTVWAELAVPPEPERRRRAAPP